MDGRMGFVEQQAEKGFEASAEPDKTLELWRVNPDWWIASWLVWGAPSELLFIDDATSRIVGLRFEEEETSEGYFKLCRLYLETHGRPLAFYSDKFSVFRVNHPGQEEAQTQFGRAMTDLDIELICAHSAQAKGRVERANGTLQDRLVKEMRLRGIKTLEQANAYLPEFTADHNQRFAIEPRNNRDENRVELPDAETLDLIFSFQYERKLSKQLEVSYENRVFQIQEVGHGYRLQHKRVTICKNMRGDIQILSSGKKLKFNEYKKQQQAPETIDGKGLEKKIDSLKARAKQATPASNHPWRRYAVTEDKKLGREKTAMLAAWQGCALNAQPINSIGSPTTSQGWTLRVRVAQPWLVVGSGPMQKNEIFLVKK